MARRKNHLEQVIPAQRDDFVSTVLSMFPQIFFMVNYALETATEGVSKRSGAVLWNIYFSDKEDKGKYLETKDIAIALREWFAVSQNTANQAVAETKKELFKKGFIITREAPKRVYLTDKG